MDENDVGKYFRDSDGSVWQMISYCESPSVTMKKVGSEDRQGFGIYGLTAQAFKPMSEEENALVDVVNNQIEEK